MVRTIVKKSISKIVAWYDTYERLISSASLVGGFIFDALVLKRVDLFIENFWIVVHLLMAAVGIILLNLLEERKSHEKVSEVTYARIHFWLIILIQGAFGGLLSTFLVFYFRSATLASSWIFFVLLILAFVANELFKHRYTRLYFQISMLFLSVYAFSIFVVPVLVHRIGYDIFIVSGIVSLIALGIFLFFLRFFTKEHFKQGRKSLVYSILSIVVIINALYFLNIIPPIPISIKDAGIYHGISRNAQGQYELLSEAYDWKDYFKQYQVVHVTNGEPISVFSAVFAPTHFDTSIIHHWQHYDEIKKEWITESVITLPIVGGRDGGYRTYSTRSSLIPGKWRVDVETSLGQDIGRINFIVEPVNQQSALFLRTN